MAKLLFMLMWTVVVLIITACAGEGSNMPTTASPQVPEPTLTPIPIAKSPAVAQTPALMPTATVWNHLDGRATQGRFQGARLTMIPMFHMTWGDWKSSHPETTVLSPDTPFQDRYRPVTIGRFNPREASFGDDRLAANALVVGVEVNGHFKGYPLKSCEKSEEC